MTNLRSPFEKLADCYHLARFTDKIRLHLAGTLPADYQMPLFHERGVDGFFMRHIGLRKEELLKAVTDSNNDDAKGRVASKQTEKTRSRSFASTNDSRDAP